jgi:hypothetical protein
MRLGPFVSFAAVVLAVVAMQNVALNSTEAQSRDSAIIACAVQGDECTSVSLDSPPGTVLSHRLFPAGCPDADLHVMRYSASGDSQTLVATWCD